MGYEEFLFTIFKHMYIYIFPLLPPLQSHLRPSRIFYSRLCRCWSRSALYVNTAAIGKTSPATRWCVCGGVWGGGECLLILKKLPILPLRYMLSSGRDV